MPCAKSRVHTFAMCSIRTTTFVLWVPARSIAPPIPLTFSPFVQFGFKLSARIFQNSRNKLLLELSNLQGHYILIFETHRALSNPNVHPWSYRMIRHLKSTSLQVLWLLSQIQRWSNLSLPHSSFAGMVPFEMRFESTKNTYSNSFKTYYPEDSIITLQYNINAFGNIWSRQKRQPDPQVNLGKKKI